jgi:N4-gp56 family major capsid protein
MTWGGTWDATNGVATTDLSAGMQIYYDKIFLKQAQDNLHMMQFAQKRPLPLSEGKQIQFFRYLEIANSTAPISVEGANPDPTAITGFNVNRTVEEWGAFSQYSSLLSKTHIDPRLRNWSKLWGAQAGRSVDLRIMKEVVTNGCIMMRADLAAAGAGPGQNYPCIENGTTASTTTTIYSETNAFNLQAALNQTNDFWNCGQIIFYGGQNYGQSRFISDSVSASNNLVVTLPFESAPADGDEYYLSHMGASGAGDTVAADAMDTTDLITHDVFARTLEGLQVNRAPHYSGGNYVMVIGPTTNAGFMTETNSGWMPLKQYRGEGLFKGEIGTYMGFRVVQTSQPFRATLPLTTTSVATGTGQTDTNYYTAGANYSVTGTGHYTLAFGQEAFGVTKLPGPDKPKIIMHGLGSAGSADPLNRNGTVGWAMEFVPAALNGLWCMCIVSGG